MGKRSDFARNPRDFYPTPEAAVLPFLSHVGRGTTFIEPCAGDGALVRHLEKHGLHCAGQYDIEPQAPGIVAQDYTSLRACGADMIVTNPPWDRKLLHPMIEHFRVLAPTWLLFDADWAHTAQAAPYLAYCAGIVSVGRVKWIPGSKMQGKDNAAWYLFMADPQETIFYGRS
jgi:hypothetical protein